MRLIGLAVTVAISLTVASLAAEAQQSPKVPRIGLLGGGSASGNAIRVDAFRRRELTSAHSARLGLAPAPAAELLPLLACSHTSPAQSPSRCPS